ncbi:acyl-CoA dehydrogenase family protein [Streptomyces sp. NL15-2K]|uniref:acyl-CoA dehydrogenase family protein n=1 Tax=Streptomyces sp. NL15-2K TaxID=376149 RepID=UPI000F564A01|nr:MULTISPECIES: acyl-CoA dehydrogenase family protein [Actinomycetes]WKX14095.1 acyl-CoA dehydrogenase family protein [Kutzneria buriramensis]GCB44755.1 acyl-CoA dehydrogenase [Streptomyces sp. NL15-2K]
MYTRTEAEPLLERVDALADTLRPTADDVDRGTASAHEGYQAVREAGLLRLLIPAKNGGEGASFLEHTRVLETLATGDAAIALGFNMHNVAIGSLCETADTPLPDAAEEFRAWVFSEIVNHGRMFASAVSESGSGARLREIRTSYRKTNAGYVLDGEKSFVSLAGVADYYVVAARHEDSEEHDEVSHFVVSADDAGVSFGRFWDGAALRGTETATMTMTGVEVPRGRLFLGVEGMSLFKLVREPHWMTAGYMGAYLGIAEAVRRFVLDTLAGDDRRRGSATVQADIGRLCVEIEATRALVHGAARLVDAQRGSLEANTAVYAAKYRVGELGPRVAAEAVRLCGSRALHAGSPLQRLAREAQFCAVMPATSADCLAYVGKAALGFDVFDARNLDW